MAATVKDVTKLTQHEIELIHRALKLSQKFVAESDTEKMEIVTRLTKLFLFATSVTVRETRY